MKFAVIGRGLWGSAAARHLAMGGYDVTLIGPSEPADKRTHSGVFGSHYDEGRITRQNALVSFWVEVSQASIARYAEIEAASGISFFTETGALMAGNSDWISRVEEGRQSFDVNCDKLDHNGLKARFPYFAFADGFSGYHEPKNAGHISPRRLVAAQCKAAIKHGATILDATVQGIEDGDVVTEEGTFSFDRILVAAGGMTDHLLGREKTLDVYARTVALFEISDYEAERLKTMPSLVYQRPEDPFLLPPIRYPDGKLYVKIGADPADVPLLDAQAIGDWFRSGGNPEIRDLEEAIIRELMPDLKIEAVEVDACVTSWTHDRLPEVAQLTDRITVCAGGNGAGAKCSDEMGRRGAALMLEQIGEEL